MLTEFKLKQPFTAALILIALTQGLGLLGLHQAIEHEFWPFPHAHWLMGLYAFFVVTPTMLLLGLGEGATQRRVIYSVGFGLLAFLLGIYVGYQVGDRGFDHAGGIIAGFIFSMSVAAFIALMLIQSKTSNQGQNYQLMFQYSWRNALTLVFAWAFVLCFWGVLMLWAGLFKMIHVRFFYQLFTETWFIYPVLGIAQGIGILLLKRKVNLIDGMASILQILMKFLLVILGFVSILFLLFLPVTGLDALWDAGGSALILTLQALLLFILNAVYQEKSESPYTKGIHWLVCVAVALLPIYSIISLYGLSLRIGQYGWTIDRCWAILIWALLAMFAFNYAAMILKSKAAWTSHMGSVNKVASWAVMVALLIINSPILDFRKITLSSQLARLDAQEVTPTQFDYRYLRNQLGQPGLEALEQLQARFEKQYPVVSENMSVLLAKTKTKSIKTKEDFISSLKPLNETKLPDNFVDELFAWAQESKWILDNTDRFYIKAVNFDNQGETEFLLIKRSEYHDAFWLFYQEQTEWKSLKLNQRTVDYQPSSQTSNELIERLTSGEYTLKSPRWPDMHIGDTILRVPPES